jgi:PKD repeat protein
MKKITFLLAIALGLVVSIPAFAGDPPSRDRKNVQSSTNGSQQEEIYLPGRIHIKFKPGIGPFSFADGPVITGIPSLDQKMGEYEAYYLAKRFKQRPVPPKPGLPDLSRIHLMMIPEHLDVNMVAKILSSDANVEYAEPVPVHRVLDVPNDPSYVNQQHLPQIMAPLAWNIHKGQNGAVPVKVAIVDAGVDWDHIDLIDNTWQNLAEDADGDGHTLEFAAGNWVLDPGDLNGIDNDLNGYTDDLIGWDFHDFFMTGNGSNPDPIAGPFSAHGTHVAGIAAGMTDNGTGIASISWNVKYIPLQTDNGANTIMYGFDAIIYAAEQGADVITNSWGGSHIYLQTEAEVIAYASGLGSIVIASAGNNNITELYFPSDYPGMVSVAAVSVDDIKTGYSSFGPGVDVSAPGGGSEGGILSTLPNNLYGLLSGTSMATPLVAGLAALIKSYHPGWTREEVIAQLISTCDNIDSVNLAQYHHMLGSGRINAFKALDMVNPQPPEELKFRYVSSAVNDANANTMFEAGETATLTVRLRNHSALISSDSVVFRLISTDPQLIVMDSVVVASVPADGFFDLTNVFLIQAGTNATSHFANLKLSISADVPVVYGQEQEIPVLVAPSGFLVFEGEEGGVDYSGSYIRDFLQDMGYEVTYTNALPNSFAGFDAIFLSFGNFGEFLDQGTMISYEMSVPVEMFAESGGKIYLEAGGFFAGSDFFAYPNALNFRQLFGVESIGFEWISNPIDNLSGNPGTLCEGMQFAESTQQQNWYIDQIVPASTAACPFYESNYGNVSVYNNGTLGQKTFYFSYSLADLVDESPQSSRYNILLKVMQHFGYEPDSGYAIANCLSDVRQGGNPLEVHFYDLSLSDINFSISSWQWDFTNDGTIDSQERNPVFTYDEAGIFDVRLIVSNGFTTDTIVKNDYIRINDGFFVFEGIEGARDYSGTWIRDFLQQNTFLPVTYSTRMPTTLKGYDVAFLSFGNSGGDITVLNDAFANAIGSYLQDDGNVYLEGSDALGYDQKDNTMLHILFGLSDAQDGSNNTIEALDGITGSVVGGMTFTGTNQNILEYIDIYRPGYTGKAAFVEAGYDTVAVQNEGIYGQKTFCFSYALAELQDGEYTREDLMWAILNFFGLYTGTEDPVAHGISSDEMVIYPNPVRDGKVSLRMVSDQEGLVTLLVYNSLGQQILNKMQKLSKGMNELDINLDLRPGTYVLEAVYGDTIIRRKIIVL